MGKVIKEFETQYEVGDVVIFHKGGLHVGIVEEYYVEDNIFWFTSEFHQHWYIHIQITET